VSPASVAVVGASGFTGGELVRLLLGHPGVEVRFLSSESRAGRTVGEALVGLRSHPCGRGLRLGRLDDLPAVDVAFCCLPRGILPSRLAFVRSRAPLVVSLAGDYRLRDPAAVARHYPESLRQPRPSDALYAVPEFTRPLAGSGVLCVPGCMAAAAIYAVRPLWAASLVEPHVIVDAKTGASGAGRGAAAQSPAERMGNLAPHKLHGHRHEPEIAQALRDARPGPLRLRLATHSLDVARGVLVTAYMELAPGVEPVDVRRAYVGAYRDAPFVNVLLASRSRQRLPTLKSVLGSNVVELGFSVEDGSCVAVASLDNLVKGAAGQAVQLLNLALGLPEETGLPMAATWP
jgi:N-acetyl-gamma-glutamyl-phosphate/LysW-gamma-L-alpha-aminoadipyl-6-phosphate reductase